MKNNQNYWPLDYDSEVELFDNPTWNLPGLMRKRRQQRVGTSAPMRAPAKH